MNFFSTSTSIFIFRLPSYDDPPARSGARESWRSQQLRQSLHHRLPPGLNRITRVRVTPWGGQEELPPTTGAGAASGGNGTSDSASNTEGSGESRENRERVRHNAETQGDEDPRDEASSTAATAGSPRPPADGAPAAAGATDSAAPSTSSSGGAAGGDQEQNQDIVRLSSHIERMQRICRQSLSSLGTVPMATQRRQVVRLQAIRRMLEDLQRQIRSLRDASYR